MLKNIKSKEWVAAMIVAFISVFVALTGEEAPINSEQVQAFATVIALIAGIVAALTDKSTPGLGTKVEDEVVDTIDISEE